MILAEHDHVVEELSPNAADKALSGPVLPRASERRGHGTDAESLDREGDFCGEDRVVVEDQESVRRLIGECISQLLDHPASRRVRGHVVVKDLASAVIDREPDVEKSEVDGRDDEEVHPRNQVLVGVGA